MWKMWNFHREEFSFKIGELVLSFTLNLEDILKLRAFSFYLDLYKNMQHQYVSCAGHHLCFFTALFHLQVQNVCSIFQPSSTLWCRVPLKSAREVKWNTLQYLLFELHGFTMLDCDFFFNERCFYLKNNFFLGFFFFSKTCCTTSEMDMLKINFHLQSLHLKSNP